MGEQENLQQQQNNQNSFLKKQTDKLKGKGKDLAKKKVKDWTKKLIIKAVMPILIKVLLPVILVSILISAIFNFLDVDAEGQANDAKATTVVTANTSQASPDTNQVIIKPSEDKSGYEISYNNDSENIQEVKKYIEEHTQIPPENFTEMELAIIGAFIENGAQFDYYTEEQLHCIPYFIKAEACTQNLDLRPNSEKQPGKTTGGYVDDYQARKIEDLAENETPGTIIVQRTNTNSDSPITLEYKEKEAFEDLLKDPENNINAKNYFTISDDGKLVVAKWDRIEVDVSGEYPENLNEDDKVYDKDEIIITTEEIAYKQYVTNYTMPFEFLIQLLMRSDDKDFCMQLVNYVLDSEIVINIQEEETITETDETKNYTVYSKDEKYIKYEVRETTGNQLIDDNGGEPYLLKYAKDIEQNDCTNVYDNKDYTVKIHTKYTSHSYVFAITKADTWLYKYEEKYDDPVKQGPTTSPTETYSSQGQFEQIEKENNEPITDSTKISKDKNVNKFISNTKANYESKIIDPITITIEDYTDAQGNKFKLVSKKGNGKVKIQGLSNGGYYPEIKDNNGIVKYNLPQTLTVVTNKVEATKNTKEIPQMKYKYVLNSDQSGYTLQTSTSLLVKCEVSSLDIKNFERIDTNTTKITTTTKFITDSTPTVYTHIYARDTNQNYEKFLVAYDNNRTARNNLNSWEVAIYSDMENCESTKELVVFLKYLFQEYDGIDRGVTELDLDIYLTSITLVGSYSSVGNISAFGCTLERDEFITLAQNYKKDNSTYQSKMANYAGDFYDVCTKYGVNPIITYAHACLETGYGRSIPYNNYFGMAVYNGQNSGTKYNSPADSIEGYCKWVKNNATVGTSAYASNLAKANKWSAYNENLVGTPDTNIYVLYCRYAYLGDTHLCNEPDFNNPKGTSYYLNNGSTWGAGGRVYIYEMYENGGLYTGKYSELCGHGGANDPTTDQEKADYAVYTTNKRINIAREIFGETIFSAYGNGTIGEQILNAAEKIRRHCTDNNYKYDVTVPSYKKGVKALWNEKGVCCASYVAWVLSEVGYEDLVNECYFRGATTLGNKLKTVFQIVPSYEQMQPGDIIFWPGHHTQIYAGNGYWYNGGSKNPTVKYSKYDARKVFKSYGSYYILRPQ